MSAAVAWELHPTPGRMPSRTARTQLRLVGPGERAMAPVRPATRISRRGRLVITAMVSAAALTCAVLLATSVSASAPQIDHATTVFAGQTLSEVAAAQMPGLPITEAVARIQLANGLNTSQVRAGQSLLIPVMP
ncbi:MAG: LysM peptidoglycan-binding domain-containing protein [Dermatophilaceae bacterium]